MRSGGIQKEPDTESAEKWVNEKYRMDYPISESGKGRFFSVRYHIENIPEEYHFYLIDWITHLVLSNHDKDAENLVKAREHDIRFTQKFGKALSATTESNRRRKPKNKGMRAKEFGF